MACLHREIPDEKLIMVVWKFRLTLLTTFLFYRLIKLASSKLNYVIGIGAIILYVDIFFHFGTDPDLVRVVCNLTPWLTAIGYSLCYGTILAKMARVYYLFNNPSPRKKVHTYVSELEKQ